MTKPPQPHPGTLTCTEVAAALNCSVRLVYDLYDRDELLGYKLGAKRVIYADSVAAYRERHGNGKKKKKGPSPRPLPKGGPYEFLNI